jgi:flagellum-specific peptidoglycan hydrolase FlgJ
LWPYLILLGALLGLAKMAEKKIDAAKAEFKYKEGLSKDRNAFIQKFYSVSKNVDLKGIPASFALAVAYLETGYGTGNVFKKTNSLFNIKAKSTWKGPTYPARDGGSFKIYPNQEESLKDWVSLISTGLRYKNAYQGALAHDYKKMYREMQNVGYAGSDMEYASKLTKTLEAIV